LWKKSEGQVVSARGASGGLGTIWNVKKFKKIREVKNTHWLYTKLQHLESGMIFSLFNLYAPISAGEKKLCWDSIRSLADSEELANIIIVGDFNLTLSLSKKRGGSTIRDQVWEWVEDWDMIDINPSSGKYTWTNKRIGPRHITARLDRFLVQRSFLLHGLESRMDIIPCCVSDHRPIKLELLAHMDQGPIPFKFNSHWVKEQSFMPLIKETWKLPVKGSAFFVWEEKLRRVKAALKTWVKTLPNLVVERKIIQERLEMHHQVSENAEITKETLDKEANLQHMLLKASLAKEEYWRLKSHSLWFKTGDRNTSFFHKQAQARKCINSISEIKVESNTHIDIRSIKNVAFIHFKNLYSEEEALGHVPTLVNKMPSLITTSKNQFLEAEISKNEIKSTLFTMEPDKAPGPNGFTARFLQSC